ncbi:TolC family protein [Desulfogranum japonicum]|uniref:TolC family protein n=1 Tax=Desulfogranum japonicum TaxID=231447 RepID=UPI0004295858|nr:TolC family protein [Desulfogranum japonicum]
MMKKQQKKLLLTALALLQLTACGFKPGTEYAPLTEVQQSQVPTWSSQAEAVQAATLFDLLDSEQLRALVQEAFTANPGLKQTRLSLQIAKAELRQTRGSRLPQAAADLSGSKEESSDESYTGSLTIRWTIDLWLKLADETAAANMDVAQQAALVQAASDTLAAEVMKTWLELIAQSHSVAIQERRLATLEKNEQYILERYRNGLGELEDLDSARSSTSSARATLVEYRENFNRLQRTLRILLGKSNKDSVAIPSEYPAVLIPLADLPEQTLARRPDLQAAYYAIASADLETSVAYKELLPSISLGATLQDVGSSPSSLLFNDPLWSILGQLTAPLFQGGSLKAAADKAQLEAAKSFQAYRETLLTAVQEVEDALGYEQELIQRITHINAALTSARNSLQTYRQSYRTGLVDILDLLTVQKKTYDLEIELDELMYQQLANRIDLGLALGLGVTE